MEIAMQAVCAFGAGLLMWLAWKTLPLARRTWSGKLLFWVFMFLVGPLFALSLTFVFEKSQTRADLHFWKDVSIAAVCISTLATFHMTRARRPKHNSESQQ